MTSSIYPKTTFTYSLEHESSRLLYVLNRLTSFEYRTRGFFFLPNLPLLAQDRAVIVPNVTYNTIPNIWKKVQKLNSTTPMVAPNDLTSELSCLLAPHYQESRYKQVKDKIEKAWSMVYRQFFGTLYTILPQHQNSINSINIIFTSCGTGCTFSLVTPTTPDLTIYLRLDQDVTAIAEGIVTALIRSNLQYELGYSWEEIESVVDFILRDTILGQVLPRASRGTIANLRKTQLGRLKHQSDKYLQSLLSSDFTLWQRRGHNIYYSGIHIDNLTPKRQLLLEEMLTKRGQTVTFEELGDILWPNGEGYSLWAIVKEISRLRSDLAKLGLPPSLIQAHRKVGYSLA